MAPILSSPFGLKLLMGNLTFRYGLWCLFFYLQGNAIKIALEKQTIASTLLSTLISYMVTKIAVMLSNILEKYMSANIAQKAVNTQWVNSFPQSIHRDNAEKQHDIWLLFFDYFPNMAEYQIQMKLNTALIYTIITIVTLLFIFTQFYLGFIALLSLFFLNCVSKNLVMEPLNTAESECLRLKVVLGQWLVQFFRAYREIQKNWAINLTAWKNQLYEPYHQAQINRTHRYLIRDLWSQLLSELPCLFYTAIVIYAAYRQVLSLESLFLWIGLSQFMLQASNAFLENRRYQYQYDLLHKKTKEILGCFQLEQKKQELSATPSSYTILLNNGEPQTIAMTKGLHYLHGTNGSGKTTLLNVMLHYERRYQFYQKNSNNPVIFTTDNHRIRVIERDCVLFDCINSFWEQIIGPNTCDKDTDQLFQNIQTLLPNTLSNRWKQAIKMLEKIYQARSNHHFSSGEKVLISCLRFFASWTESVELLIIDECDAFLDAKKKHLWLNTLRILSRRMTIHISSHTSAYPHTLPNIALA